MKNFEIPLLPIEMLYTLVQENRFINEKEKRVCEKTIKAQNDWDVPLESLDQFISILEKEVSGQVSKSSLTELLTKYNRNLTKYAWRAESLCSLLEIFDLAEKTNLREVFISLSNRT